MERSAAMANGNCVHIIEISIVGLMSGVKLRLACGLHEFPGLGTK